MAATRLTILVHPSLVSLDLVSQMATKHDVIRLDDVPPGTAIVDADLILGPTAHYMTRDMPVDLNVLEPALKRARQRRKASE